MFKKFFVVVAVAALFAACGGNQNAKQGDACADSAVCIGKAIANPAEYAGKEMAFAAKIAKCDSTGLFYACADSITSIEIVPAQGVVLTDVVGKAVTLTGKIVNGKIEVAKFETATCCSGDKMSEGACCGDKKEGSCGDKKEGECSGEKKEGCCDKKEAAKS